MVQYLLVLAQGQSLGKLPLAMSDALFKSVLRLSEPRFGKEVERGGVDLEALSERCGAVSEHMAKMGLAL